MKIFMLSPVNTMILFLVATVTSPLLGVVIGGKLADSIGGYKGDNMIKTIKLCGMFSIVSILFAIPAGFTYSIWYFFPLFWFLVFFGACMVPSGTAIAVSCVPKEFQSASSAVA